MNAHSSCNVNTSLQKKNVNMQKSSIAQVSGMLMDFAIFGLVRVMLRFNQPITNLFLPHIC